MISTYVLCEGDSRSNELFGTAWETTRSLDDSSFSSPIRTDRRAPNCRARRVTPFLSRRWFAIAGSLSASRLDMAPARHRRAHPRLSRAAPAEFGIVTNYRNAHCEMERRRASTQKLPHKHARGITSHRRRALLPRPLRPQPLRQIPREMITRVPTGFASHTPASSTIEAPLIEVAR